MPLPHIRTSDIRNEYKDALAPHAALEIAAPASGSSTHSGGPDHLKPCLEVLAGSPIWMSGRNLRWSGAVVERDAIKADRTLNEAFLMTDAVPALRTGSNPFENP